MTHPFLSERKPEPPQALIKLAQAAATPRVALVNAGSPTALRGIREAREMGLATPILVGDPDKIARSADEIDWDTSNLDLIVAPGPAAAHEAARLAREGSADAVMKGQIHTSTFLKGLLPSSAGLREKGSRCGHVFHITLPGRDAPLFLTDGALNVDPDVETRKACLKHAIDVAQRVGIKRPRAAMLAPSEDPTPGIPNTFEAAEIAEWAKDSLPEADVAGPISMDLLLSSASAQIKGYDNPVAGKADIICVPNITSGNALFKLMVLGMGACAAGIVLGAKVPILLTSRAQGDAARIASAALGVVMAQKA
ncbi:MAG: phosphate acyltransferase [Pseudomonadota bacterium]